MEKVGEGQEKVEEGRRRSETVGEGQGKAGPQEEVPFYRIGFILSPILNSTEWVSQLHCSRSTSRGITTLKM